MRGKYNLKTIHYFIVLALLLCFSSLTAQNGSRFPELTGPYLGQKPPGTTPEIFAPGIVSTGLYTRDVAITSKVDEIYFGVSDAGLNTIFVTKLINGRWTEPAIVSFSGKGYFDFEPHISPDGKQLYFLSNRPPSNQEPKPGWFYQNIWMTTRTDSGWGEPQLVDKPISTDDNEEFFPSLTKDNTLYFTRMTKEGAARIYKAAFENGQFKEPEIVPLNTPDTALLFNAFISPEENYIIVCGLKMDSTNVDQDFYISFKLADGNWSKLIKFGPEINTPGDNANSAYVSPDGKYLFFNSSRKDLSRPEPKGGTTLQSIIESKQWPGHGASAIYWINAKIIEDLRPKN
jgi:hypothetical protein